MFEYKRVWFSDLSLTGKKKVRDEMILWCEYETFFTKERPAIESQT
jgi:hypothetical protein